MRIGDPPRYESAASQANGPSWDTETDAVVENGYLPDRRPVAGDHLTLFTVGEIAYWTRQGESTIRRWINNGKIGPEYLTRPGGRIFMTGDQLMSLIASWRGAEPKAEARPLRRRRTVRLDPHKPAVGKL